MSWTLGLDPDLQEVHRLGGGGIEFAVHHAGARAHALHVAGPDARAVADRVLVRELPREHVADDLHVAMTVGAEARARPHTVLVDHAQRAELDVLGIEVIGERKAVL